MSFFSRKSKVVDLTEQYGRPKKVADKTNNPVPVSQSSSENSGLGFFGAIANTVSKQQEENYSDISESAEEKRRKLTKRLIDITEKLEELSNQIYHLQQRVEVVERKLDVNRF